MPGEKLRQRLTIKMTVKWWSVLVTLTCCSIRCAATNTSVRLDLRPVSSNDPGAIPDLIEIPNPALDPKPTDLNVTTLLAILGDKFDQNYMSILMPEHIVPVDDIPFRKNHRGRLVPPGKMPKEIREMDFKYFTLADGQQVKTQISDKKSRMIQQFLWGKTACLVRQQWKDLGIRFWPQWLLEGQCSKGKESCSIPAGMYCQAADNQYMTLLRWYCRATDDGPSAELHQYNNLPVTMTPKTVTAVNMCRWIMVEYPVVTECSCGCASDVNE